MFDLIIIGSGPAGLAASIYASRYHLKHLILGFELGGTISWAHKVDNYPGLPGLSGKDLAQKFIDHAKSMGGELQQKQISQIEKTTEGFKVSTDNGKSYETKAVILATGTKRRELGVPGEKELVGKGVSYCPTCDAPFYNDKTVVIVGGANAACSGAVHLAKFAKKVYLLYRKNQLRAEPSWLKEIEKTENITVVYETNIKTILSNVQVAGSEEFKAQSARLKATAQSLKLEDKREQVAMVELDKEFSGSKFLATDGVFVEIGGVPATQLAASLAIKMDNTGYIETNDYLETNVKGIYCVGDCGSHWKEVQQVITATAEGAVAAYSVYKQLHQ